MNETKTDCALKLSGLTKVYPAGKKNIITAVDNLNLNIPHGSVYGFLGRNGAGKTTTLKMVAGLSKPTDGEIFIYGRKVEFGKPASYKNIGFLPDVPEFYSFMSAREYLFLCGRLYKMTDIEIKNKIREIFELINFDKKRLKNKISAFSRGMKQKLGIAAALIHSPDLIMLDEPTSALDPIGRKETIDIINSLRGRYTVVFSTHILSDVERVCDKIALIEKGGLILDGNISDIKAENSGLNETLKVSISENTPGDCERFLESAKKLNYLNYIDLVKDKENDNIAHFSFKASDRKKAGESLPKIIYESGGSLVKFAFEEINLEDIFVSATASGLNNNINKQKGGV
ncbi:MAG: ABC transporter ATP-binding protein [Oscillospiraceae bacterium]|nr:ABC transporter ATP-binding protein [Oscillospiraceae bacterium]